MMPFNNLNSLPKINAKEWLLKHATHKKINEETIIEEEFRPHGSYIPTKERVTVLKSVVCEDCKEVLFYDGLSKTKDLI